MIPENTPFFAPMATFPKRMPRNRFVDDDEILYKKHRRIIWDVQRRYAADFALIRELHKGACP
jgi:hypothetical protein